MRLLTNSPEAAEYYRKLFRPEEPKDRSKDRIQRGQVPLLGAARQISSSTSSQDLINKQNHERPR